MTHLHTIFGTHLSKQFHTGHINGNINNDYFYTHIYILYTVINEYMSQSAPFPSDPLPPNASYPCSFCVPFCTGSWSWWTEIWTELIPQSWGRLTKAGESSGRFHRCQKKVLHPHCFTATQLSLYQLSFPLHLNVPTNAITLLTTENDKVENKEYKTTKRGGERIKL